MPGKNEPTEHAQEACLVARVIGNSKTGFIPAIQNAIGSLGQEIVSKISGVDILSHKLQMKDGVITNYRVVVDISYDGSL